MESQNISSLSNNQNAVANQVSAKLFSAKFRGKRECWNFLAVDVGAWLPPYENITIYHMKDLISGKKQTLKADAVKHIHIPQYETLTIKKIMELAKSFPEVTNKLPDREDEIKKFPKSYLCDLIYTIVNQPFKDWVKTQISDRNAKLAVENNLMIQMDPAIATAFQKSNAISLQHGLSSNLLKIGAKRRRTRQEMLDAKEEEALRNQSADKTLAQIQQLKDQLTQLQAQSQEALVAKQVVQEMVETGQGQFEEDGSFSFNGIGQ